MNNENTTNQLSRTTGWLCEKCGQYIMPNEYHACDISANANQITYGYRTISDLERIAIALERIAEALERRRG